MKRLSYRDPVDADDGSHYAPWLRALKNKSGVYVIRDRGSGEILYVGESHKGHLYSTLTRHFQSWFLDGFSGRTYSRGAVDVATRQTPPGRAEACQQKLIERLHPRDNIVGGDADDDDFDFAAGDF